MKKIAINGFGRIGRLFTKAFFENKNLYPNMEIILINAAGSSGPMTPYDVYYALMYDSNYGNFNRSFSFAPVPKILSYSKELMSITVFGKEIKIIGENDVSKLPWKEYNIDIVVDCSGESVKKKEAGKHLQSGAKKVIVSAPFKKKEEAMEIPHIVMGINQNIYNPAVHNIISNASCTTNALAPILLPLEEKFGIRKGLMTTIHAFTGDQRLVDAKHKDLRRSRRAGGNIIKTSTGAAGTIHLIIPSLESKIKKIDGICFRVDTPTGSIIYLTVELKSNPATEELIKLYEEYAKNKLNGILGIAEDPIVSLDTIGMPLSVLIDKDIQLVEDDEGKRLYGITGYYDNEWGYAMRLVDLVAYVAANEPQIRHPKIEIIEKN